MTKEITFTVADFVAEIVLNRPQKHNAMTPEMAARLQEVCAAVDRDDAVQVVLIKGAGERAFSSGSDLNSLAEYPSAWAFRNRVSLRERRSQREEAGHRRAQEGGCWAAAAKWRLPPTSASPAAA